MFVPCAFVEYALSNSKSWWNPLDNKCSDKDAYLSGHSCVAWVLMCSKMFLRTGCICVAFATNGPSNAVSNHGESYRISCIFHIQMIGHWCAECNGATTVIGPQNWNWMEMIKLMLHRLSCVSWFFTFCHIHCTSVFSRCCALSSDWSGWFFAQTSARTSCNRIADRSYEFSHAYSNCFDFSFWKTKSNY